MHNETAKKNGITLVRTSMENNVDLFRQVWYNKIKEKLFKQVKNRRNEKWEDIKTMPKNFSDL